MKVAPRPAEAPAIAQLSKPEADDSAAESPKRLTGGRLRIPAELALEAA
jgi:hypothetical protein